MMSVGVFRQKHYRAAHQHMEPDMQHAQTGVTPQVCELLHVVPIGSLSSALGLAAK